MWVSAFGQRLTLTDLTNLCSKNNWEDVNQSLLSKGWVYYDSQKGSTYKYSTITWSFNKDFYNDKAQAWFNLYTYDGFPNKISYTVLNKDSYSLIQNSILSAGFKLIKSEIEDNQVISVYGNSSYTLEISTEKVKENNWSSSSLTSYNFTLIKKSGIYDDENGKKTDYYYGDVVKAEYTLTNGKLNGPIKVFYENGKLKKTGQYVNGFESGIFREYDELGNLDAEYTMLNGKRTGLFKVYENGKLSYSNYYLEDKKNGQFIDYYYDKESGDLFLKQIGEYVNDIKTGTWKLFYLEDNKEDLLKFENYTNGVLNGPFQDVKGDSLIIGTYKNEKLHGDYKIYRDIVKTVLGGIIRTDLRELTLISEGAYFEGLKSGYWKNYDITKALVSEGGFSNGLETGEWKYYYTNWSDGEGGEMPYSRQLFLIANYAGGKLDGKSIRYSYLDEEEYPCSELDSNKNPWDTCKRYVYKKVNEISYYKNGKLNGPFEYNDITNDLIAKGYFKDDLKDGEWVFRYSYLNLDNETFYRFEKGNFLNDKKEGKWIESLDNGRVSQTFNYKNGELHGESIKWNEQNTPLEKKQFANGKLKELVSFDSLGIRPIRKYEIYDERSNSFKCRFTEYLVDGYRSQEYWRKKDEEINHVFFEISFLISINDELSDGTVGYKDGTFELFDLNNNPIVNGKFFKEERIGLWTYYYHDQNVKIEYNYVDGKPTDEKYFRLNGELFSGEFIFNHDENGVMEKRKVKDGFRNGATVTLDKNNKVIKKENYKNGLLK